jgi:signal transduction histidine kinase
MSAWAAFPTGAVFGALVVSFAASRIAVRRRRAFSQPLHELRGAIAAIQLGLFGLDRRGLTSVLSDRVEALRAQAQRAHMAVEDVDDIRLARRSATGRLELFDAGVVVRRRVAAWSGFAETRRRSVELRWPIGPAVVRADELRIGQALDNLIVNALDHGGGVVCVTGALTESTVRIAVADQGQGIGRPLRQVMSAPWHGRHGHGLAVAARVAELHGGRLTATSGRIGSKVEIELPLAEPPTAAAIARPPVAPPTPGLERRLQRASGGGR